MTAPVLSARTVPIALRDRPAWLSGIVLACPGTVFEDEATGERVRVLADGRLDSVVPGGYPRPPVAPAYARPASASSTTAARTTR